METGGIVLAWPFAAQQWTEALPVGNGRLGAMVFGGTESARWQVNDSTIWSGSPSCGGRALAQCLEAGAGPAELARLRADIAERRYADATRRLMAFEGPYSQEFLPFVDLLMTVARADSYHGRRLDLGAAVVCESFDVDGHQVVRRTWASYPDRALCIAVECAENALNSVITLSSPLRVRDIHVESAELTLTADIPIDGAPAHEPGFPAWTYLPAHGPGPGEYWPLAAAAVTVDTDGSTCADAGGGLRIDGASRILVVLTSATAGERQWAAAPGEAVASGGPEYYAGVARSRARDVVGLGAAGLLDRHIRDFRELTAGTAVRIGDAGPGVFNVPDEILGARDDQKVATVICEYGRYLLASSSRADAGPPANLQGIWNAEMRPAWSSNYTININTQMNYWLAQPGGLPEVQEPLNRLLHKLSDTGRDVARELYGTRGWVTHHNTDMWGWSLPVGAAHSDPSWAVWQMGGVWLTDQMWEQYEFTQDIEFLARAWPVLRGAAEFCLDWLVEGADGRLGTNPSTSPENHFLLDGERQALSVSATMDIALIRKLFANCLGAIEALGIDDVIAPRITAALARLPGFAVTGDGRLQEWSEDYADEDRHHRHISQAVAVYPLGLIGPDTTPALAGAARALLDSRGPGAMGWSWAWKIALRARLRQPEIARSLLEEATRPYTADPTVDGPVDGERWGGLLPNLFSTHPPFQADANYGLAAAIIEMLVQSHGGRIQLLPALPRQWDTGMVRGIRARGGFSVDLEWAGGRLQRAVVTRIAGGPAETSVIADGHAHQARLAIGERLIIGPRI